LRGRHHMRLVLQAPRDVSLQDYVRHWLAAGPKPKGQLLIEVDIDPVSFM
jgi:primosomal protein N' (replication factor Y) (superfamily II helicase)